jgi:hypothetical protein
MSSQSMDTVALSSFFDELEKIGKAEPMRPGHIPDELDEPYGPKGKATWKNIKHHFKHIVLPAAVGTGLGVATGYALDRHVLRAKRKLMRHPQLHKHLPLIMGGVGGGIPMVVQYLRHRKAQARKRIMEEAEREAQR